MFGKKRCGNCGEKVEDSYNYCPYCQAPLKDSFEEGDWGILGKNDFIEPGEEEIKLPMGLNALFNSLMKNLNKQMKDINNEKENKNKDQRVSNKSGGISISISTSGNSPPEIKVRSFGNVPEFKKRENQLKNETEAIRLPNPDSKKFSGLPKKEPETDIRRFSNRVVYEIKMPGVKSPEDISIVQLENSIEIKALANKKVFYKIIPINLPIRKYNLSKGILTLELDSKE